MAEADFSTGGKMTTKERWLALAGRSRGAVRPDEGIDADIATLIGLPGEGKIMNFHVSRSLEGIVSFIHLVLPGWAWRVGTCSVSDDAWLVPDFNCPVHGERLRAEIGSFEQGSVWDVGFDIDRRPPDNPALCEALCLAKAEMCDAQ